ncbi:MAG: helix-hairpin-helix domain-containing protein [Clostridia bacterium]
MELTKMQKIVLSIVAFFVVVVVIVFTMKISQEAQMEMTEQENLLEETNVLYQENEEKRIVVHVAGFVENPGIVKLKEGSRIADAIEAAGGELLDADLSNVNLAYMLEDGQKLYIPGISEQKEGEENLGYITKESGDNIVVNEKKEEGGSGLVNLNTASQTELEQIPGIGPSTALKIIEYRKENGEFKSIEDIKNVKGIGDSKYENMKNHITV